MRLCLFAVSCLLFAWLSAGCTPKPVTDSEFRGFCYTSEGGRNNSCDTITMCNVYDSQVISTKFASRKACNDACNDVYNELAGPNQFNGCMPTIGVGLTWCSKYCNSNYPE
ncbi:hypothetical protein DVDV_0331 [Desulfovibrio sp. DV]|uniref:hypothetical protein n=1 Tax=Desulfovibrio sp. DV TaxID=1844708 RepID=UPI00095EE8D4|nr:hypothetical protein [Desulfovibrio sp. DV]OLN30887.1 hypothetical protein DVDV_0331 [Desulfovibrio sp. DV]